MAGDRGGDATDQGMCMSSLKTSGGGSLGNRPDLEEGPTELMLSLEAS